MLIEILDVNTNVSRETFFPQKSIIISREIILLTKLFIKSKFLYKLLLVFSLSESLKLIYSQFSCFLIILFTNNVNFFEIIYCNNLFMMFHVKRSFHRKNSKRNFLHFFVKLFVKWVFWKFTYLAICV